VPPRMLMCREHWFAVPKKIRDAVWRQCDDKNASEEWHRAADAAIGFLSVREQGVAGMDETLALGFFGFEVFDRNGTVAVRPTAASTKGPEEG
jgi:hypothetical protein